MTQHDWYKKWFGNEYLTVYSHRDLKDAKQLVHLILSHINLTPKSKILDICCGQGRHVSILAKHNFQVFGLDLSRTLLDIAKQNTKSHSSVNFIQADMRSLPVTTEFDLVLNLFTSFGYFESDNENSLVLHQMYNVLKRKGFFVFDYFNSSFVENNLIPVHEQNINNVSIKQERYIKDSRINKKISIVKDGKNSVFYESVKIYQPEEIYALLENAGLKITKIFGNYSGSEFKKESSRLLIIGEKSE